MRDIPRFVEMLHRGQYDAKTMVTRAVPLRDMLGAYEEVIYRQVVTTIMTV
jgi:Zn-dependent alcohol dehydrogenase